MKKIFLQIVGLIALIIIPFSFSTLAQERVKDIPLKITDEEKSAVLRILKTIDTKLWSLQNSRETYGAAKISESRMQSIKAITGPGDKGIIIHFKDASVIYLKDGTSIYVAPVRSSRSGQNNFLSVLGKTKTAQLKAILAKYLGAPDTLDAINIKTMDDPETGVNSR